MKRCVDSGLWVANAGEQQQQEEEKEEVEAMGGSLD